MIAIAHAGAVLPAIQRSQVKCGRSRASAGRVFILRCTSSAPAAPASPSKISIIDELLTKLEQRPAITAAEPAERVARVYKVRDEELVAGKVLRGRVISIVRYGAFVDIGARITGMIHVSRLGAGLVTTIADVVSVGEEIDVEVVLADIRSGRIELKRIVADEQQQQQQKKKKKKNPFPSSSSSSSPSGRVDEQELVVGKLLTGRVKSLVRYGAFVDVGAAFDGFIPVSGLGLRNVTRVEDVIRVGEEVNVQVVVADFANRRIQLRRILTNADFRPDEEVEKSYSVKLEELVVDKIMTGKVRSITPYGAFVDLGACKDGLLHISNLGPEYAASVEDVVKVGDEVVVQIILADLPNQRIQLRRIAVKDEELVPDKVLTGRVKAIVSYGAFVDVGARFKGLLHITALGHHSFVNDVEEVVKVGEEVKVQVVEADVASGRVLLRRLVAPPVMQTSGAGYGSNTVVKATRSYERGEWATGVVIRRNKFGVWVQLAGNEGFLQKREMRDGEVGEMRIGKEVKVRVDRIMGGRIMLTTREEGEEQQEQKQEQKKSAVERINEAMNENVEPARTVFESAFRRQPLIRRYLQETGVLSSSGKEKDEGSSVRTGKTRSIKSHIDKLF